MLSRNHEKTLRERIQSILSESPKPLAGLGSSVSGSPFTGSANGHASFIAEWAVYFAAKSPGDLTEGEWEECKKDRRYSAAFERAESAVSTEGESGDTAANLLKLKNIVSAMKSLASEAIANFGEVELLPGTGSEPKPGNDEVDVELTNVDIHVKLNDDHRVGGLGRGKLAKGQYLSGYISTDIYYRAIERFVEKHILNEETADKKYRDKIVDVQTSGGKTKTFITTSPEASSNITLGTTTLTFKTDSSGQPILGKKGVPEFESPVFELSREMSNLGVDITDQRFVNLWERSKIGGPHVHVPDPHPKNPARTGYGVEFRSGVSPKDLGQGSSYLRVTPKGAPHLLETGKTSVVYTHYMESGFGNMKTPGKDPQAQEAQQAYFQMFRDNHDEFMKLLDEMGYVDAIVTDATRKLFGVELGAEENDRKTAYIKFTVPWSKAARADANSVSQLVSIESVVYPGIPEMKVVELPLRNDVNPSVYYSLQGTEALEGKEIAYVKFRHFDGNRPPQVFLGKDSKDLTREIDIFSSDGAATAFAAADVKRQLSQEPAHPSTTHFSTTPSARDEVIQKFMRDSNIVVQKGVDLPPVSRNEILRWVNSNWQAYKEYVPEDEVEDEREGKTWLWAMIAQNLQDVGLTLTESAKLLLKTIIKEITTRKKKMLSETRASGRGGIAKRPKYLKKFAEMLQNPELKVRLIKDGGEVLLDMTPAQRTKASNLCEKMSDLEDPVASDEYKELVKIFQDSGTPLSQISKSIVTGKDSDSGTEKEDIQIDQINAAIQKAISDESNDDDYDPDKGISLYLGRDKTVRGVVSCVSIPKTPKADAALVDYEGNQVAFISLKYASKGSEQQQWSGISSRSGLDTHPEIQSFIQDLIDYTAEGRLTTAVYREINDDSLKARAIYGPALSDSESSPESCDLCIATKGVIQLSKESNQAQVDMFSGIQPVYSFSLKGSGQIKVKGDVPEDDEFRPVLAARYGKDRGKSQGLTHIRAGIFTIGWALGRTAVELQQANDRVTIDLDRQMSLDFQGSNDPDRRDESVVREMIQDLLKNS